MFSSSFDYLGQQVLGSVEISQLEYSPAARKSEYQIEDEEDETVGT